jgi:hypothetical protein
MKIYSINTSAIIGLGNGEKAFAPMTFSLETNDIAKDLAVAKNVKGVEFSKHESIEVVGESYKVGNHPSTNFMGIKFAENTIRKVNDFKTNNLAIHTDKDTYNISYGHLVENKRAEVINNFFNDLNIKRKNI